MKTARLLTLSEGIFAIALTLLVLERPIPKHSAHLAHDLVRQWPFYAAYAVSFLTIAIAWINHHPHGRCRPRRSHPPRAQPLTAAVRGRCPVAHRSRGPVPAQQPPGSRRHAHPRAGHALLAISFSAIWLRLAHAEDLAHPALRPRISQAIHRSMVGPTVYAAGTATSLISPPTALLLYALVPLFFAVTRRRTGGASG